MQKCMSKEDKAKQRPTPAKQTKGKQDRLRRTSIGVSGDVGGQGQKSKAHLQDRHRRWLQFAFLNFALLDSYLILARSGHVSDPLDGLII